MRERKKKRVCLHVVPSPRADKQAKGSVKWDDRCWVCINSIIYCKKKVRQGGGMKYCVIL